MKNEQILKKAIEKGAKNQKETTEADLKEMYEHFESPEFYEVLEDNAYYPLIFDHDFAKAFWGEEKMVNPKDKSFRPDCMKDKIFIWQYNLQEMVLKSDPIQYLKKFI